MMACMPLNSVAARLQRLIGLKTKAAAATANEKRTSAIMHISAPFNFKRESICLPGLSAEQLAALKEKAAASRAGLAADAHDDLLEEYPTAFSSPRKAPRAPPSPTRAVPAVHVTPSTPLLREDNVI